jgi:hypothetical protein
MDMRSKTNPSLIELHIEELILTGFAARDRLQIGSALEHELSRLITQRGVGADGRAQTLTNAERLNAGAIHVQADAKPRIVGQRIAQAVYRQLSPATRQPTQQRSETARSKP